MSRGPSGSSPLNTPTSSAAGPYRTAPITTARSGIWARWWLTGNLTNGRDIGSSVPYGANPLPTVREAAARPRASRSVPTTSCSSVWGWRLSTKPSPQTPGLSSPPAMVSPSRLAIPFSSSRPPHARSAAVSAGCVSTASVRASPANAGEAWVTTATACAPHGHDLSTPPPPPAPCPAAAAGPASSAAPASTGARTPLRQPRTRPPRFREDGGNGAGRSPAPPRRSVLHARSAPGSARGPGAPPPHPRCHHTRALPAHPSAAITPAPPPHPTRAPPLREPATSAPHERARPAASRAAQTATGRCSLHPRRTHRPAHVAPQARTHCNPGPPDPIQSRGPQGDGLRWTGRTR